MVSMILSSPHSELEELNLARNGLGFKTGAHLMSILIEERVKHSTHLWKADLTYNNISLLV